MIRPPTKSTLFPYTTLFRSFSSVRTPRVYEHIVEQIEAAIFERRRSEEHTSELQSHSDLVCRLLLEKKTLERAPATELVDHRGPTIPNAWRLFHPTRRASLS